MSIHTVLLPTGKLSLDLAPSHFKLDDLTEYAARQNPKRGFLFVSKLLAKYWPSKPAEMQRIHQYLAKALEQYVDGKTVFVGMAEAAAGLGQGVYESYLDLETHHENHLFIHTSRYLLAGVQALDFQEQHSHASQFYLYVPFEPVLQNIFVHAQTLVLIDDEVTTGTTFVNLIKAYLRVNLMLEQVVIVSILNFVGEKRQQDIQQQLGVKVRFISALAADVNFTKNPDYQYTHLPNVLSKPNCKRQYLSLTTGRVGIQGHLALDLTPLQRLSSAWKKGHKILMLGTGEFVHVAFLMGQFLVITEIIPLADVAITRSSTDVDQFFLDNALKVKSVVRAGVGVDNVDIEGCSKKGIVVMNVPTANTIAAVELTMAHMLSCVRQFPYAHNNLKIDRVWRRQDWYGTELNGKKLGIIGFGNIGSRVGKRAKAFEMDVIAYDPYIDPRKATDTDISYTKNFEDILACDIITIHTPKNKETLGIIDRAEIAKMKDGVVLINCARGGLYDEDALLEGLTSGKIHMAGIDVFNKEPATDHPLLDLDNVTVTPHLGANTKESQQNIAIQAAQNAIEAAKCIAYPNALNLPIKESELPNFLRPYLELIQKNG